MGIRPAVWLCLFVGAGASSCMPAPPRDYAREEPIPGEPLYADFHILEIGGQVQDIAIRAISEAVARLDRDIPDYGPLSFTTSLGLQLTYEVTADAQLDHHTITIASAESPLSDEVALNLLHFVTDLLGVDVSEATRRADRIFRLSFDLDRKGQSTLLENLQTVFDRDDVLELWKQAVLEQLSKPIRLETAKADPAGARRV